MQYLLLLISLFIVPLFNSAHAFTLTPQEPLELTTDSAPIDYTIVLTEPPTGTMRAWFDQADPNNRQLGFFATGSTQMQVYALYWGYAQGSPLYSITYPVTIHAYNDSGTLRISVNDNVFTPPAAKDYGSSGYSATNLESGTVDIRSIAFLDVLKYPMISGAIQTAISAAIDNFKQSGLNSLSTVLLAKKGIHWFMEIASGKTSTLDEAKGGNFNSTSPRDFVGQTYEQYLDARLNYPKQEYNYDVANGYIVPTSTTGKRTDKWDKQMFMTYAK